MRRGRQRLTSRRHSGIWERKKQTRWCMNQQDQPAISTLKLKYPSHKVPLLMLEEGPLQKQICKKERHLGKTMINMNRCPRHIWIMTSQGARAALENTSRAWSLNTTTYRAQHKAEQGALWGLLHQVQRKETWKMWSERHSDRSKIDRWMILRSINKDTINMAISRMISLIWSHKSQLIYQISSSQRISKWT